MTGRENRVVVPADGAAREPGGLVQEARSLLKQGRSADAVRLLEERWRAPPRRTPGLAVALVEAHIERGNLSAVREIIETARGRWPDDLHVNVAHARLDVVEGRAEQAVDRLAPLDQDDRLPLNGALLLARTLHAVHRPDEALGVLSRAEARSGSTLAISRARTRVLLAAGRFEAAEAALSTACARWPGERDLRRSWARSLLKLERFAAAIEAIGPCIEGEDRTEADCRLFARACIASGRYRELAQQLPAIRHDWSDENLHHLHALTAGVVLAHPELEAEASDEWVLPLSDNVYDEARLNLQALIVQNLLPAARLLADRLLEIDASCPRLKVIEARLQALGGEGEQAQETIRRLLMSGRLDARDERAVLAMLMELSSSMDLVRGVHEQRMQRLALPQEQALQRVLFAEHLLSRNMSTAAMQELDRVPGEDLSADLALRANWLRLTLAEAPAGASDATVPCVIAPDDVYEGGLVVHYRFSKNVCVIWFAGIIPSNLAVFQQYVLPVWKRLGVSVITVVDPKRLASLGGFGCYFPNRKAAEQRLVTICRELGYRRIATSGMSLAGFSAMLYGCHMGAAGSLVFAGPSHIPLPGEMTDSRGLLSLHRLRRSIALETTDLEPLLAAHPGMVVHHHFGLSSEFDARQARRVEHLSNVRLFGADHGAHGVLQWLHDNDLIEEAIAAFVAAIAP